MLLNFPSFISVSYEHICVGRVEIFEYFTRFQRTQFHRKLNAKT